MDIKNHWMYLVDDYDNLLMYVKDNGEVVYGDAYSPEKVKALFETHCLRNQTSVNTEAASHNEDQGTSYIS